MKHPATMRIVPSKWLRPRLQQAFTGITAGQTKEEGRRGRPNVPPTDWSGGTPDLEDGPEVQQRLVRTDLPVANAFRNRGLKFVPQQVWVGVSRKVDDVPWFSHALWQQPAGPLESPLVAALLPSPRYSIG